MIKKGDNVIVIAGKDRGKTGKVERVFPSVQKLIVAGVNKQKKHERAKKEGQKGQVIEKSFPIHASNVMVLDPKSGKGTRIGKKLMDGKYVRVAQKSGTAI